VATVSRWLVRLGLNQRRWLDVDGEPLRTPGKITARYRGHMVHLDVKKVGRIPDGGGWRVHGRDSEQHRAAGRAKTGGARAGYVYLHSAVDGYSRLAYTEHLPDETATTAIGFWARARAWFAAHGITRITRVITDKRLLLPVEGVRPGHQPRRPAPADPPLHAEAQRESRALPGARVLVAGLTMPLVGVAVVGGRAVRRSWTVCRPICRRPRYLLRGPR